MASRRRRKKAGRTIDGLTLLNGAQLEQILEEMPRRIARRVYQTGLRKSALELRRSIRAAAPKGRTGLLKKSIGMKKGRRRYWVGLQVPQPPRKTRRGRTATQVRHYYKRLDLVTTLGQPSRPWFEAAVKNNLDSLHRTMLESVRSEIRRQAGRAHALSRLSARGGASRGGRF